MGMRTMTLQRQVKTRKSSFCSIIFMAGGKVGQTGKNWVQRVGKREDLVGTATVEMRAVFVIA